MPHDLYACILSPCARWCPQVLMWCSEPWRCLVEAAGGPQKWFKMCIEVCKLYPLSLACFIVLPESCRVARGLPWKEGLFL